MFTKMLFLFLSLFSIIQLCAQEYEPIIKEGSFWDIKTIDTTVEGCEYFNSLKRIQVATDTLINNKTYKKLKAAFLKDSNNSIDCISEPFYIDLDDFTFIENTFLREDTTEKKLYLLTNSFTANYLEEYTISDFSLSIGDQIVNYYGYNNTENKLLITDIVVNSESKKVFHTSDGSYYTEGIGRNEGNLNIYFNLVDGTYERLYCYGNDQNQNNCATVLSTESNNVSTIAAYPNPIKNILTIQNPENSTIKIFSITGSLLKTEKNKTDIQIDLSTFKAGVYILEISNLTGKKTSKILKI